MFSPKSYKNNTGFRKILVISKKTMSKHLVFHADPFKILEFLISMVSMTISSHSAYKETEDFH